MFCRLASIFKGMHRFMDNFLINLTFNLIYISDSTIVDTYWKLIKWNADFLTTLLTWFDFSSFRLFTPFKHWSLIKLTFLILHISLQVIIHLFGIICIFVTSLYLFLDTRERYCTAQKMKFSIIGFLQ